MSSAPTEDNTSPRPKLTVLDLQEKCDRGEPIAMLTAYDFPTAQAADRAGIDVLLVGDSLAMVVLGHPNTLSVTMDVMLHHARAVSRGARAPWWGGDLPFRSCPADTPESVRHARRVCNEAGLVGG
jgi:3-methyl-2-oxobutanoate hydroxymethyltransferase